LRTPIEVALLSLRPIRFLPSDFWREIDLKEKMMARSGKGIW
jgi:hypothetical protein